MGIHVELSGAGGLLGVGGDAHAVRFAAELERWGTAVAIVAADERLVTYDELARLADEFAGRLGPDVRLLAIEAANALAPIAAYLGALRCGVPVMLYAGEAAWAAMRDGCRPDAAYRREADAWRLDQEPLPWRAPPHPDLAVMLSTSGTTGSSKFVRLSGRNLQANAASIADYLGLGPDDRAITSLPPSYSYGLSVINSHLLVGGAVVLTEASVLHEDFRALSQRHRVTSLAGVPSSYDLMEKGGLLANLPPTVRTLTQAGGRMSPEMVERVAGRAEAASARLFVMYGQTEAAARIAYLPPDLLPDHAGFIGKAIPGGELWVEAADGVRAAIGAEGELLYRGPNVMMGYAISREDLAAPAGADLLRTGDIAIEAEPSLFRITGRKSRFVKPFGLRVGLDDLEARCRELGAQVHAAGDDDLIVLGAASEEDLTAARAGMLELKLPDGVFEFVRFDAPPLLANGKVDSRELLELGRRARALRTGQDAAADDLRALFRRLARGRLFPGGGTFEELGGDSLTYVQGSILVEEALGHAPDNWSQMTLAELLDLAQQRKGARRTGWTRLLTVESNIVARCLAITVVVLNHTLGAPQGGSDVLMLLAGFSWARFQRVRLIENGVRSVFADFLMRYVLVYLAIMLVVFGVNREVNWPHLTFISTIVADWGGVLNIYWFIETLIWCVGLVCLAFLFPAVRRFAKQAPVKSGLVFVLLALAVRVVGALVLDQTTTIYRTPDQMLLYFAVGWTMSLSTTPLRIGLALLVSVTSLLAWGWGDSHTATMIGLSFFVALAPSVRLPAWLAAPVRLVAAASFYIYLTNIAPMYLREQILRAKLGDHWLTLFALSMVLGLGLYFTVQALTVLRAEGWRAGLTRLRARFLGVAGTSPRVHP